MQSNTQSFVRLAAVALTCTLIPGQTDVVRSADLSGSIGDRDLTLTRLSGQIHVAIEGVTNSLIIPSDRLSDFVTIPGSFLGVVASLDTTTQPYSTRIDMFQAWDHEADEIGLEHLGYTTWPSRDISSLGYDPVSQRLFALDVRNREIVYVDFSDSIFLPAAEDLIVAWNSSTLPLLETISGPHGSAFTYHSTGSEDRLVLASSQSATPTLDIGGSVAPSIAASEWTSYPSDIFIEGGHNLDSRAPVHAHSLRASGPYSLFEPTGFLIQSGTFPESGGSATLFTTGFMHRSPGGLFRLVVGGEVYRFFGRVCYSTTRHGTHVELGEVISGAVVRAGEPWSTLVGIRSSVAAQGYAAYAVRSPDGTDPLTTIGDRSLLSTNLLYPFIFDPATGDTAASLAITIPADAADGAILLVQYWFVEADGSIATSNIMGALVENPENPASASAQLSSQSASPFTEAIPTSIAGTSSSLEHDLCVANDGKLLSPQDCARVIRMLTVR